MKRTYVTILLLAVSLSAFSQRNMIIFKHGGTHQYIALSSIDSLIFRDTTMIVVMGGTFTAGSTTVTISSFNIDKYEVTYEKWTAVKDWALVNGYTGLTAGSNGSNPVGVNNPITTLNWYDAVKWCNARSQRDGFTPVYYTDAAKTTIYKTGEVAINAINVNWSANGYRLPTEAEWEFAAKGGTLSQGYTYSGSNTVGDVAWYYTNSSTATHTVGTKTANELGLYDMSGNALEWCWDWYSSTYPNVGTTDPQGPTTAQSFRVLRGGSFYGVDSYCRSAYRDNYGPYVRYFSVGFRCVQD